MNDVSGTNRPVSSQRQSASPRNHKKHTPQSTGNTLQTQATQ